MTFCVFVVCSQIAPPPPAAQRTHRSRTKVSFITLTCTLALPLWVKAKRDIGALIMGCPSDFRPSTSSKNRFPYRQSCPCCSHLTGGFCPYIALNTSKGFAMRGRKWGWLASLINGYFALFESVKWAKHANDDPRIVHRSS